MKVFKKITAAVTSATMFTCGNINVLPKEAVRDLCSAPMQRMRIL